MSAPLVSIVTPSYNQGRFLEETILSVLEQDYPHIEYIVIDGGSTDQTLDIIAKYADRLSYWVSERDGGQSDAINKGWRRARGSLVHYLNSDDLLEPGAVSRVVEHFVARPHVGAVYGSFRYIDGDSRLLFVRTPADFSLERLLLEDFMSQATVFLRREVLDRIGFVDAGLHYVMDYDLWLRAALQGTVFARLAGEPLASYRHWRGNKSSNLGEAAVAEEIRVKASAFASEMLPARCRRLRRPSLAATLVRAAYDEAMDGNRPRARRLLLRAARTHWPVVATRGFVQVGSYALGRSNGQPCS